MGNVLQLSLYDQELSKEKRKKILYTPDSIVKVKVLDFEHQLKEFWQWMTALVITDIEIANKLHILNPRWPFGTYIPTDKGWCRSQLGAKHYKYHNHRLCAFVYHDNMIAELQLEWQAFVNCYC